MRAIYFLPLLLLGSCQTQDQIRAANRTDEDYCRSIGQSGPGLGLCMRDQQSRRQTVVADRNARLQAFANAAQQMAAADAARYRPMTVTTCHRMGPTVVSCTSN